MWRSTVRLLALLALIAGCTWWNAGMGDPAIVENSSKQAANYRKLGEASGFPWAGSAVGILAFSILTLIGGKKKLDSQHDEAQPKEQ